MSKPDEDPEPELQAARTFDSARLIADVRAGDAVAIREAYRVTFGTALGRIVLLHALTTIGRAAQPRPPQGLEDANHENGRAAAVLEIAGLAGFDPVAIAAAGLTQELEGADYERGYGYQQPGRPDVIFGDERFDGGAGEPGDGEPGSVDCGGGFDRDR